MLQTGPWVGGWVADRKGEREREIKKDEEDGGWEQVRGRGSEAHTDTQTERERGYSTW